MSGLKYKLILSIWLYLTCFSCSNQDFQDGVVTESGLAHKINARDFPSVFQAWNGAENLPSEDSETTIARHDLYFSTPVGLKLRWDNQYAGLAESFTEISMEQARQFKNRLQRKNPNLITIAALLYRDAHQGYLPEDSPWWMRDSNGVYVPGWKEGNNIRIDFANEDFQQLLADKARAAMQTGAVDGIMLDWWDESEFTEARISLLKKVREAIGEDGLILLNANSNKVPRSAPYANGLFMECWDSPDADAQTWEGYRETLEWAEQHLCTPRINCLETWYKDSRDDHNRMRATTTLVLTRSNGYCLFSDPNDLPKLDHLHDWYSFWDAPLGKPKGEGVKLENGAWQRDFTNGVAVYNPKGNRVVEIKFDRLMHSKATGLDGQRHVVKEFDGDIFLPI